MRSLKLGLYLMGALTAGASAQAPSTQPAAPATQTPSAMQRPAAPPTTSTTPTTPSAARAAPRAEGATSIVDAAALEAGSNSFTEGQARGRFEDAGFTSIQGLVKDDAGFWRARGMRNGSTVDVAMDFRGRIAAGPGVAALPRQSSAAGARGTTPTPPSSNPATTR